MITSHCTTMQWILFIATLYGVHGAPVGTRTLTRKDNAVASGYQIDHALSHKRTVDNIHIEERAKRDDIAKWCDTGEEDECTDREYCNVIGKYCADCADICGVEDNSYRQMCQNKCPTEYAKQQATSTVTAGLKQTRETTNSVTPETSAPHYNESMIQTSVLVCLIVAIVLFLIVLLVGLILGIRLCISRSNPCGRRSSNETNTASAEHLMEGENNDTAPEPQQ